MLLHQSFDQRFILKLNELRDTYGQEMFKMSGIDSDSMDISKFAKKFFKTNTVSDYSTDPNGNCDDNSVLSFEYEFSKSIMKLNSYYLLWKKMTEDSRYGIKRANKIIELCINGALKIHDLHFFLKPYCYAFSVEPLVSKGMPFIKKVKIAPPKHFDSFINLIIQLTSYISNQTAGAISYPDSFIYMDYFARKDYGENYLEDDVIINIEGDEYCIKESVKLKVMNKVSTEILEVTAGEFFKNNMIQSYLIDVEYLK